MVIAAAQRRLPKSNAAVAGDNRPARRRSSEPNAATEAYSVGADVYCIVLNNVFFTNGQLICRLINSVLLSSRYCSTSRSHLLAGQSQSLGMPDDTAPAREISRPFSRLCWSASGTGSHRSLTYGWLIVSKTAMLTSGDVSRNRGMVWTWVLEACRNCCKKGDAMTWIHRLQTCKASIMQCRLMLAKEIRKASNLKKKVISNYKLLWDSKCNWITSITLLPTSADLGSRSRRFRSR